MCGIIGALGTADNVDAVLVQHRGPDRLNNVGLRLGDTPLRLGHARLAIVDLSETGNQPLTDPAGELHLIFNGEIYNHQDLRGELRSLGYRFTTDSDGEVILHLYKEYGIAGFERLNGIYALALADLRHHRLVLARDPLGVKPLFWAPTPGGLAFASEISALRTVLGRPTPHDVTALAQFLTFMWVPEPRTPYGGISPIAPGTALSWTSDETSNVTFCDLVTEAINTPLDDRVTIRATREVVRAAVQRQLMADVPVAIMASGGIDSSLIWRGAGDQLERAFTIDWRPERTRSATDLDHLNEDTETVEKLASKTGVPVTYVRPPEQAALQLPPDGSLNADPAYELTALIAGEARRQGFKVLLSGHGGDEVFGGYRRHVVAPFLQRAHFGTLGLIAANALKRVTRYSASEYASRLALATARRDPFERYMTLCSYSDATDRAKALGTTEREVSDKVVWASHRALWDRLPADWSLLRKGRMLDLFVYLPGLGLSYADRAGMRHGVEIRVPLLDLELVRWSFSLPERALVNRRISKALLRRLAAEDIGRELADRPKRGFGMPSSRLSADRKQATGRRGFRQASYFDHASRVTDAFLETTTEPVPSSAETTGAAQSGSAGPSSPHLEGFYHRMPVPVQNLMVSGEGWRVRRARVANVEFKTMLREAEARSSWTADDVRQFQDGRVRDLVMAAQQSPFWRQRMHDAGIRPDEVTSIDDLGDLPVLTKDDVVGAGVGATTQVAPTVTAHTSGTTGAGFHIRTTPEAIHEQWAVWWRYRRWHGIDLDTRGGHFGGRNILPVDDRSGPFWRYDRANRRVLFSAYHLNATTAGSYAEIIRRRKLPWLHGYPSFLALLANFLVEKAIDVGPEVRWVTTGAENLGPTQAHLIEKAFGVRPIQHYGLAEGVANASQCPAGLLHLDEDFAAMELLPREDGPGYRVIGTALSNHATPLIRYDTGDVVTSIGECGCGRTGLVVAGVDGRSEDYVRLADGSLVGRLDHVFKDLTAIREAQVHQHVVGAVTVKVLRRDGYGDADDALLKQELRKRLGAEIVIDVEHVEALPRSDSGKLRLVVSHLRREEPTYRRPADSSAELPFSQS